MTDNGRAEASRRAMQRLAEAQQLGGLQAEAANIALCKYPAVQHLLAVLSVPVDRLFENLQQATTNPGEATSEFWEAIHGDAWVAEALLDALEPRLDDLKDDPYLGEIVAADAEDLVWIRKTVDKLLDERDRAWLNTPLPEADPEELRAAADRQTGRLVDEAGEQGRDALTEWAAIRRIEGEMSGFMEAARAEGMPAACVSTLAGEAADRLRLLEARLDDVDAHPLLGLLSKTMRKYVPTIRGHIEALTAEAG